MTIFYLSFLSSQLVEGTCVLKKLEEVPTYNERPKQDCRVADCGVFEPWWLNLFSFVRSMISFRLLYKTYYIFLLVNSCQNKKAENKGIVSLDYLNIKWVYCVWSWNSNAIAAVQRGFTVALHKPFPYFTPRRECQQHLRQRTTSRSLSRTAVYGDPG